MAKAKTGPKGPRIILDKEEVYKLAAMHCTWKEIAAFFECSVDTLERNYADVIEKGYSHGKAKLRRLQWQSAEKGNVVMQIFLGKAMLGQKDKVSVEHSGQGGGPILLGYDNKTQEEIAQEALDIGQALVDDLRD